MRFPQISTIATDGFPVDAAGFRADLLACAQQWRVFWKMIVGKSQDRAALLQRVPARIS